MWYTSVLGKMTTSINSLFTYKLHISENKINEYSDNLFKKKEYLEDNKRKLNKK